jgi:flavodoxin
MIIPFIYASTSGNVEATMEHIAAEVTKLGIDTPMYKVEKTSYDIIRDNSVFVLGTSTWEHGVLNPFWDKMLVEISKNSMTGKKASFVGLGDIRYEPIYFCRGIDTLRDKFVESGGEQLGLTLKVNGDPYKELDKLVAIWTGQLIEIIKKEMGA